jgi:hypothetical protein
MRVAWGHSLATRGERPGLRETVAALFGKIGHYH